MGGEFLADSGAEKAAAEFEDVLAPYEGDRAAHPEARDEACPEAFARVSEQRRGVAGADAPEDRFGGER